MGVSAAVFLISAGFLASTTEAPTSSAVTVPTHAPGSGEGNTEPQPRPELPGINAPHS